MSVRYRRASEINSYLYCRRAWWLQYVQGLSPRRKKRLQRGVRAHHKVARQARNAAGMRRLAIWLIALATLFILLGLLGF